MEGDQLLEPFCEGLTGLPFFPRLPGQFTLYSEQSCKAERLVGWEAGKLEDSCFKPSSFPAFQLFCRNVVKIY